MSSSDDFVAPHSNNDKNKEPANKLALESLHTIKIWTEMHFRVAVWAPSPGQACFLFPLFVRIAVIWHFKKKNFKCKKKTRM